MKEGKLNCFPSFLLYIGCRTLFLIPNVPGIIFLCKSLTAVNCCVTDTQAFSKHLSCLSLTYFNRWFRVLHDYLSIFLLPMMLIPLCILLMRWPAIL